MSYINEKLSIGNIELKNRVVIQPMEGCDGASDGSLSELTIRRYHRFAKSGAGLIWFEAVAVSQDGRANPRQLFLNENNKEDFRKILREIREISIKECGINPIIIMQMTHSGRQSRPISEPCQVYASNNKYLNEMKPLRDNAIYADEKYCDELIEKFAKSSMLAKEVGFDGVDVKCCHGYLFNEFMSAYDRDDKYGGESIENRARLYIETYKRVREVTGADYLVTSRFGIYDGFNYPYGFGVNSDNQIALAEAKWVISKLIENGLNMINITIGNPYINPHVNRPYKVNSVEDGNIGVQRVVTLTTDIQNTFDNLAVVMSALTYNGVNSMDIAEKLLKESRCKLVGFGRMAFAYPEFYRDYLKNGKLDSKKVCLTCSKCSQMMRMGGVAGCPIRDSELYLPIYQNLLSKNIN